MNDGSDRNGLTTLPSPYPVKTTIDRLSKAAEQAGLLVFARIDHSAGAAEIGLPLRPTELVLFGHPRGGTPLMHDRQTAGIDLPLRALAWEDESGQVWLTYNDAEWIAERHHLGQASSEAVAAIRDGVVRLASLATGTDPSGRSRTASTCRSMRLAGERVRHAYDAAVDEWLTRTRDTVAAAAGVPPAQLELDDEDVQTLLDLARIAAHESGERTNAPLLCYLLGRVEGRATLDELAEAVRRAG